MHNCIFHRSVLEVDHFSMDFMDGGGEDVRVDKSSARDKRRTTNRNQDRAFRDSLKASF
jgi:hypothetical protein